MLQAAADAAGEKIYVEDVFSTYLYTGNGSTQTITNGIDLSGKGGLVWVKGRSGATGHRFTDTARGATRSLESNSTAAEANESTGLTSFSSTGFALGADADYSTNADTYASWTFRKAPKFFDVVTYTGNGSNRTIAHSLGSVPGSIIVKRTDTTAAWAVYHRSLANTQYLVLDSTAAAATGATWWNSTTPTSSVFSVGTDASVNASGGTYVAYVFAHDAGGFGLTGTDNVISCGSFTTDASAMATVNLGYEPQWLMVKASSTPDSWYLVDSMRGWPANGSITRLFAQDSTAEGQSSGFFNLTSTGFATIASQGGPIANATFIYIAIRRGPMKVPTLGTTVYDGVIYTGNGTNNRNIANGFAADLVLGGNRTGNSTNGFYDRLRGPARLATSSNDAELTALLNGEGVFTSTQVGMNVSSSNNAAYNSNTVSEILNFFKRAPSFFDIVCYTGTGTGRTVTHNLAATPELMIVKRRDTANDWWVYDVGTGNTKYNILNSTTTPTTASTAWNNTSPTSSVFSVGSANPVNASAGTHVAYLFATCVGVSKVGSYTGTGTTLQINCGFAAGARFVLIKRTDSTGDWYVWDTARGIISGDDPYLLLNSTAAEVTNTDYIDPLSSGFQISSTAPAAINANGGSFIFLAIA